MHENLKLVNNTALLEFSLHRDSYGGKSFASLEVCSLQIMMTLIERICGFNKDDLSW